MMTEVNMNTLSTPVCSERRTLAAVTDVMRSVLGGCGYSVDTDGLLVKMWANSSDHDWRMQLKHSRCRQGDKARQAEKEASTKIPKVDPEEI